MVFHPPVSSFSSVYFKNDEKIMKEGVYKVTFSAYYVAHKQPLAQVI